MCADLTVGTGYAGSLTINRSAYIFGSITTANEINVTTAASQTITLASRGTVNLSYGNRTLLDAIIQGPTTTNINANLGSPAFNTNRFLVATGIFNTNGFTVYTNSLVNAGAIIALGTSEIFSYGTCTLGVLSPNTASIFLMNGGPINGTYLFNVNVAFTTAGQSVSIAAGGGTVTLYGTITDKNPNYPATQNYSYGFGSVTFTTNSVWDLANGSGRIVTFNGTNFINNSTRSLQTLTATFQGCTASGTFSGADFNAFGLANFGGNTGITFPSKLKTYAFRNTSAQQFPIPNDFIGGSAKVIAIGAGGSGVTGSGGGGGAYAESIISGLTPGQLLYISDTSAGDAWINTLNAIPVSSATGVLAKGGSGSLGGQSVACIGTVVYSGGSGGTGLSAGGGGGGSATQSSNGGRGGIGGNSRTNNNGGGGGGGITSDAFNVISQSGTAGGGLNGGTAGVGGASNTAGGNATLNTGGGGGGGGGGYATTTAIRSGTYARASVSTSLTINIVGHQMTSGVSYPFTFSPYTKGTYDKPSPSSLAPTIITTITPHGLTAGQLIYLSFTGTFLSSPGTYSVLSVTDATTFRIAIGSFSTAGGAVDLFPIAPSGNRTVTVNSPDQVSIVTSSRGIMPTTPASAIGPNVTPYDNPGLAGGSSTYREDYTFDYLNTTPLLGTTGPAGGTGGGAASSGFAGGNAGMRAIIGYPVGGGGGSGGLGTTNGTSTAGYPGLVLLQYAVLPPPAQGYIIG
jgi:hypothetical protein